MKRTIIFDFGGVLIDWNPRYLYSKLFDDDVEMEWFLETICNTPWNLKQDEGRPFAEAVELLQRQYPLYHNKIKAYHTRWPEMLNGQIDGTVQILEELLADGYTVYGLTNWSAETFPVALELFGFLHKLHGIVVSGEEKLVKPNPEIFTLLLNRYNLKAEDCIFIDDNAQNVEAAKNMGIETILFTTPEDLRNRLEKLGVL